MSISTATADAREIYRALVVDEFTDVSWDEYIRLRSRADDGRGIGVSR